MFINNVEVRTKDEIRNLKNYMIIFNTLMRKGAEVGKVHPFYIHGLSSGFAVRIEDAKTKKDIELLWNEMTYAYCRLVKKHAKRGYSPLVQNVVMLIDADLNEDLTLKAFANKFNVNASYLSSLFKKDTGLTLTEYVNRKRVEKGKELLENNSVGGKTLRSCGCKLLCEAVQKIYRYDPGTVQRKQQSGTRTRINQGLHFNEVQSFRYLLYFKL